MTKGSKGPAKSVLGLREGVGKTAVRSQIGIETSSKELRQGRSSSSLALGTGRLPKTKALLSSGIALYQERACAHRSVLNLHGWWIIEVPFRENGLRDKSHGLQASNSPTYRVHWQHWYFGQSRANVNIKSCGRTIGCSVGADKHAQPVAQRDGLVLAFAYYEMPIHSDSHL